MDVIKTIANQINKHNLTVKKTPESIFKYKFTGERKFYKVTKLSNSNESQDRQIAEKVSSSSQQSDLNCHGINLSTW